MHTNMPLTLYLLGSQQNNNYPQRRDIKMVIEDGRILPK
jgi:hypothetical protein